MNRKEFKALTKEDDRGCWVWQLSKRGQMGYGQVTFEGTQQGAHRVAWKLFKRKSCEGLHVLHHCDVPACVNPGHLYLGTDQDNKNDMVRRGRQGKKPNDYKYVTAPARAALVSKFQDPKWRAEFCRKVREGRYGK